MMVRIIYIDIHKNIAYYMYTLYNIHRFLFIIVIFVYHHYIINRMKWFLSIHVMPTWQRPRLTAASPVLKAMLDSSMQEGESRRIRLEDCSSASVSLFLETLCPAWKMTGWWWLEPWSFMTFHSVGNGMSSSQLTFFTHPMIFQRGRSTTNQ